jgi:predicted ATP-grasp superfamily ATP-dependent carboligase
VSIQQFIEGRPANAMLACWKGELLGIVTVEVLSSQGATGAATVVRLVKNQEIEQAAHLLARRFSLNGFHGLDFMIQSGTGAPYLIELNPRCTQLGHLRQASQSDLAGLIAARLTHESEPMEKHENPDDYVEGSTVAFFPQTIIWNPKSPYLRSGYHDVPWSEPGLVRELLRPSWPERQWLSRIYHHFRAPKRPSEMKFQDAPGSEGAALDTPRNTESA